jgi:hypothetical protein
LLRREVEKRLSSTNSCTTAQVDLTRDRR